MFKTIQLAIVITGLAVSATAMSAKADLIQNGSFETTTHGTGKMGTSSGATTNATGWTTSGYNFIFSANGGDNNSGLELWGPANGGAAGNTLGPSPDGGNYIGADGAYQVGAITQTITGLVAGQQYNIGFYYAGAQQKGYSGITTEQWLVKLGNSAQQATSILTDSSHGFTGWNHAVFTFTADGSSDVLSFLASGTPDGEPPFSLLDGVTMTAAVPEPASMFLMGTGLAAIGLIRRRRAAR
jgi:hypothetical protein